MNAGLLVFDTPVGYASSRGPSVWFTLTYLQREALQPQVFSFGNVGPQWTHGWLSYAQETPSMINTVGAWVYLRGGGWETFDGAPVDGVYPAHWRTRAQLVRTSLNPIRYERRLPDGSVEMYGLSDGAPAGQRRIFLTEVIDSHGHSVHLTYDAQFRLVAIQDAIGQVTTLSYEWSSDPLKITRVTDPFGRSANFTYTPAGQLKSITDVIGLTSEFAYETGDFLANLTTPYGTTTFRHEPQHTEQYVHPFIEVTDPLGETEHLEFRWVTTDWPATVPSNQVPVGFEGYNVGLDYYNSIYWDRRGWKMGAGNLAFATVTHWLLAPEPASPKSSQLPHSIKRPLEGRLWYAYPGQTAQTQNSVGWWRQPSVTARVLDNGSPQRVTATYNDKGYATSRVDPLGRSTTFSYAANGVDLLEVRQTTGGLNELTAAYGGYTAAHQPTTMTDAAGQVTTMTYTADGQLATLTNPKQETTTYAYDGAGRLQSVTKSGATVLVTYTYDGLGRIRTVTDLDGYTVTTDYDALDRPVRVTYPDGTYDETAYDRLDPVWRRDRQGRLTRFIHNARREQIAVRDPLGRLVQWSEERLIDGKGQTTTWERDVRGRVTRETRADGVTATLYTYEPATGRLSTVTDPKQQITTYTYNLDDTVQSMVFSNAAIATLSVSYTYDPAYARVTSMTDGTGVTLYTYHAAGTLGAGQIASVDGPLSDDTITYDYDELGRVATRAINGVGQTLTYDALGRATQEVNALGTFTYGYDAFSNRIALVTYPNGQTSAYSYYPMQQDTRLETIHHRYPGGATLSRFDYSYDAAGNIVTWRQQADAQPAVQWVYTYDAADQLVRAVKQSTDPTPAILRRYAYGYDPAGNRTVEQVDDAVTGWTYDSVNRLATQAPAGMLRVAGTINEPATVTVNGIPATVNAANEFGTSVPATADPSNLNIRATDANGNSATVEYAFTQSGPSKSFTFDANGNLTSDGTRTFEWDARNQLVAVTVGTHRSEFTYDGQQRRVRAVEKENGVVQSDTKTLWCNSAICEDRAADGTTVTRRVFAEGEQVAGASRFFAADHLGSVTDVTDGTASVLGRYNFDAWGRRTVTAGTDVTRVGFTGHYTHSPAGLSLAWFRGYDAELGQWISDDPAGFVDGPNLHAYVRNNPIGLVDPDGRQAQALPIIVICSPDPVTKGALIAAGIAASVVVIWKACEDGNCFGDKERKEDRDRRCEAQYAADSEVCRRVKKRSCWAQAAERYSACLAGRPIPPFNF